MTNRRQFLQLGGALCAAAFLPAGTLAATGSQAPAFPVYRILHDVRFPGSFGHARSLQEAWRLDCVPMQALAGDITRFWHTDLSRQWQKSPDAIAGVTGEDILFCLEQLARDHRMRVLLRHTLEAESDGVSIGALVAWSIARA